MSHWQAVAYIISEYQSTQTQMSKQMHNLQSGITVSPKDNTNNMGVFKSKFS